MDILKCKMCGGDLHIEKGSSVAECEYCGTKQTLPKLTGDKKTGLFDRANSLRRQNEFDKASAVYEQILSEDGTDPEIYWSLVLCKYGIEYVEDPGTGSRIPTIHRTQHSSVFVDENFKMALEYADENQKAIYNEEAAKIEQIQNSILNISNKEEPFDVFICYKETDENGERTQDSVIATDLYHRLTKEGFKVFFSRITLESKLGSAYEPYIFAALNSARVMVAVGTKPEYFNSVWVRNEWSRYLKLMEKDSNKTLIPAYQNMSAYDLPKEFSYLQAQDMSKIGFLQDLIAGIKKILADTPKNNDTDAAPAKKPQKKSSSGLGKGEIIGITAAVIAVVAAVIMIFAFSGSPSESEKSVTAAAQNVKSDGDKSEPADNDESDKNIVEPSDVDWDNLNDILLFSLSQANEPYDCNKSDSADALNLIYNGMGFLSFYDEYYNDVTGHVYSEENYVKDPKGIFELGYAKYPVENVNWILKNIMNIEPETVPEIKYEDSGVVLYAQDGFYYAGCQYLGDEYFVVPSNIIKKQLVGGKYEISLNICSSDEMGQPQNYIGNVKATVAAKEVDGRHFWSIYSYNKTIDYNY